MSSRRTKIAAVVLVLGSLLAIVIWRIRKVQQADDRAEGERQFQAELQYSGITSAQLLNSYHDEVFTGSASWWFKFSISPADVPTLESHFIASNKSAGRNQITVGAPYSGFDDVPEWWQPDTLEAIKTVDARPYPGAWIAISVKTGTGYLYRSGH